MGLVKKKEPPGGGSRLGLGPELGLGKVRKAR